MDYHHHARLTIIGREELAKGVLEGRLSLKEAEAEFKRSRQTAAKWVKRYREQGVSGLCDRSSRPLRSPRAIAKEKIVQIEQLRRQRWTGVRIALELGMSTATVSRVLRRLKLNRIRRYRAATASQPLRASAAWRHAASRYQAPCADPATLASGHKRPSRRGQRHRRGVPAHRHR